MKKILILLPVLLMLIPITAYAANVDVSNYFYAHANAPGVYVLADRQGTKKLHGDQIQHDATIMNLSFRPFEGLSGEKLYIKYDDGTTQNITEDYVQLNKTAKSIQIILEKTTYKETFISLYNFNTDDESNGGTYVGYYYIDYPPTEYGDLGNGTPPSGGGDGGDNGGGGTQPISFPVQWNDGTRRITWSSYPAGTYEVVITDPNGIKVRLTPDTKALHIADDKSGTYKVEAVKMDGTVIATRNVEVPLGSGGSTSPPGGRMSIYFDYGRNRLSWDPAPTGTVKWVVTHPDGHTVNLPPGTTELFLDPFVAGEYKVEGKDVSGNITAFASTNLEPWDNPGTGGDGEGNGGTDSGSCNGCQAIKDALKCPEFDEYLGKWGDMIRSTFPPPPDWDMVADKIGSATIRHLSDYMGNVPDPPSQSEINQATSTPLPVPDKSVETDDLVPKVPSEYNSGKIVFELNNTPGIQAKDESKPFNITEPLSNMQYDDPGKAVIPGDSRNNSGGIKTPDQVNTGGAPTPKQDAPSNPVPGPSPSNPPSTVPIPGGQGGGAAIPGTTEGPIPIPKNMD